MDARRVIEGGLRAAPVVLLGFLYAWTAVDIVRASMRGPSGALQALLVVAAVAFVPTRWRWGRWTARAGLFALGAAYLGAHVAVLGIDVLPSLAFVTLLIVFVELDILAGRFAPLYARSIDPAARSRIDAALGRALLRLSTAAVLAVLVPLVAADLALAGIVPATTIPTAIALAGGIVAVAALLALLPALRLREESG